MSVGTKTKTAIQNLMVLRKEKSGHKTNITGWPKRRSKMARLFLAAADLLRQPNRWIQNEYATIGEDPQGNEIEQFCLVGAIREINPRTYKVDERDALIALAQVIPGYASLKREMGETGLGDDEEDVAEAHITGWNDERGRQKRTVIKALERAAEQN